jgi:tRNA pseudouridine55 synthase
MVGAPSGILIVKKEPGMTSHDVVMLVRRKLGVRRIGHTGTLDPIASGVLLLVVGGATAHQQRLQGHQKIYEATICLGAQTDTGDSAGRVIREAAVPALTAARVEEVLASCLGASSQTPPMFSAVKVRGRPLYWWARQGMPQSGRPRPIHIYALECLGYADGALRCRITCSAGTYVRTLAETIAQRLGTVGHVSALSRLAVGPWTLEQAVDLCWIAGASPEQLIGVLQPVEGFVHAAA